MDVDDPPSAFAEGAPNPGDMLPGFTLPGGRGEPIGPGQYKGRRNLVLIFVHGGGCDLCRDLLTKFAERYSDYQAEEAEVLAVAPVTPTEAASLANELQLPFPLLADADGAVHRRYGAISGPAEAGPAVFAADRYGEIQQRWRLDDSHLGLPGHDALVDELRFLGIQCPE